MSVSEQGVRCGGPANGTAQDVPLDLTFFFVRFLILCVRMFCLQECMYTTCLQRQEEGIGSPGTRITEDS